MYSRQIELLARERVDELISCRAQVQQAVLARGTTSRRGRGRRIRNQTGRALVSLGLRLAESGPR